MSTCPRHQAFRADGKQWQKPTLRCPKTEAIMEIASSQKKQRTLSTKFSNWASDESQSSLRSVFFPLSMLIARTDFKYLYGGL